MALLKRLRKESKLKVYVNAIAIRIMLTYFMLKDFNDSKKVRNLEIVLKDVEDEDKEKINKILEEYDVIKTEMCFPEYFIIEEKNIITKICREMCMDICMAQSIFPVTKSEFEYRRLCMDKAIGSCQMLFQEMQFIIDIIHPDVEKYLRYVDPIEKEISLLKAWKKSDNRKYKNIFGDSIKKDEVKKVNLATK